MTMKIKERNLLQTMKMAQTKQPLMLSIDVPPLCTPVLVGNHRGVREGDRLRWVESLPKSGQVLTWRVPYPEEGVLIDEIIDKTVNRALEEGWDVLQQDFESAKRYLNSLGIEEVRQIGNLVVPKDPSLLGTLIISNNFCFPVIHNLKRGICIIQGGDN